MKYVKLVKHVLIIVFLMGLQADAEPFLGRAVIAVLRGDASYEGAGGKEELKEGMALIQGHRIETGGNGSLCASLSPGALLCVRENSQIDLQTLEHISDGLPGADNPPQRKIVMQLSRGGIMLHAGDLASDRSIEIEVGVGMHVLSTGGSYIMAADGKARHVFVEKGSVTVKYNGESEVLQAGTRMTLSRNASDGANQWDKSIEKRDDSGLPYNFEVCRKFFVPLAPLTFDWDWGNLSELNDWIEPTAGMILVGDPREWEDVSPSVRKGGGARSQSVVITPAASAGGGKWRRPEIWSWYKKQGTLRGVNYLPRTAVNSIEMWDKESFDPETIDEELRWAADIGLTSVRVFLPYVIWRKDAKGLKNRMEEFLSLADDHAISTVFVLFDDRQAVGFEPHPWSQPDPVPGVHNSRWVASPGGRLVSKSSGSWPSLKKYVQDVVERFDGDDRVLMWDVYNEAGFSGVGAKSLPLLDAAFKWIREIEPDQPVTAGISLFLSQDQRQEIMKQSDVVTLADYESADQMMGLLTIATTRGRPVICTGWLERERRSTFKDILPLFSKLGVGWYNWGLVQGRTQLYMPFGSKEGAPMPEVWGQDLLNADGEPFDEEEIKLIKGFSLDKL